MRPRIWLLYSLLAIDVSVALFWASYWFAILVLGESEISGCCSSQSIVIGMFTSGVVPCAAFVAAAAGLLSERQKQTRILNS